MDGNYVAQEPLSLVSHRLDLVAVLVSFHITMVMETVADLKLTIEEPDQKKQQEKGQDGLWDQNGKELLMRVEAGS